MLKLPDPIPGSRPDLVTWVVSTCVTLPDCWPLENDTMYEWLESRFGESRPGNILQEALDGWIDYFDGDWQVLWNPFDWKEDLIIWFARKEDLTEFVLTWT